MQRIHYSAGRKSIAIENITDWALGQFEKRYSKGGSRTSKNYSRISKNEESHTRYSMPVTRLIPRKEQGIIEVDTQTALHGVPAEAWEYRLGTYSALEWILERYKEKRPRDPTIAEKFNTYRFVDYKEGVIELLRRVCTVSVETIKIIREMP